MAKSEILADIKERLNKKTIHELRQIARVVGVARPSDTKKDVLIEEIIQIATCEIPPAPRSARGAPPKSTEYDRELVTDIEKCIEYYSALKDGTGYVTDELIVADGQSDEPCCGILVKGEKYYFLRVNGALASPDDVFVHETYVNRFKLKEGDMVEGESRRKSKDDAPGLVTVIKINGFSPDGLRRIDFNSLTPVYPHTRVRVAASALDTAARMVDLFAPVGMGQRGVVLAPANSGKTTLLKQIATGISLNQPNLKVVVLLLGERPEDINDVRAALPCAELYSTTFDMEDYKHAETAKCVTRYLKNLVECGYDVALIADGLSNLASLDGRKLLSCAICAEEGGSLTVISFAEESAVALGRAANMHVTLSEALADFRIYPAMDVIKSYTARCELLQGEGEICAAAALRGIVNESGDHRKIISIFESTQDNEEIVKDFANGR